MLTVWSGWWWLRKTCVTASGATSSAASGSRIRERLATIPGSATMQRVAVTDERDAAADAVVGVAGVEQVDGRHGRDATPSQGGRARLAARADADSRVRTARDSGRPARRPPGGPMTVDRPADLVLTGGRIATMDAARSLGERPGRPRRADRGGRARRERPRRTSGRRRGSSSCAVGR